VEDTGKVQRTGTMIEIESVADLEAQIPLEDDVKIAIRNLEAGGIDLHIEATRIRTRTEKETSGHPGRVLLHN